MGTYLRKCIEVLAISGFLAGSGSRSRSKERTHQVGLHGPGSNKEPNPTVLQEPDPFLKSDPMGLKGFFTRSCSCDYLRARVLGLNNV